MHDTSRSNDGQGEPADWEAIARFAGGESDPAEAARVSAWLVSHPAEARLLHAVSPMRDRASEPGRVDVDAALATVRARMKAEGAVDASAPALTVSPGGSSLERARRASAPARPAAVRTARRGRMLAIAAALLLVAGYFTERSVRRVVGGMLPTTADAAGLVTPVGVRDSMMLADGSRVVLAPGSRLVVSDDFAQSRLVTLEGAAYFEVRHDEARPFTVRSGHAEIRDIGTAFSVNTDAAGAVTVAVTEGIVSVRRTPMGGSAPAASAEIELRAGDRGVLPASEATAIVARGTVTPEDVAWTSGTLVYRDTPLRSVQADLRRWYGIDLRISDSALATRTLTASFRGEPADQVLRTIALALGAETTQMGDTVLLRAAPPGSGATR